MCLARKATALRHTPSRTAITPFGSPWRTRLTASTLRPQGAVAFGSCASGSDDSHALVSPRTPPPEWQQAQNTVAVSTRKPRNPVSRTVRSPHQRPPTASRVAAYATHHAYAQEDIGEDDASPAHQHAAPALFSVTDCPHFPIFCTITYSPDLVSANVIDRYRTRLFGCLLFVRGRGVKPPTLRRQAPYESLQRIGIPQALLYHRYGQL